jgi:hypothetical protein
MAWHVGPESSIVECRNGSVALLQLDPGVDEIDQLWITTRHRIRQRNDPHIGLENGDL